MVHYFLYVMLTPKVVTFMRNLVLKTIGSVADHQVTSLHYLISDDPFQHTVQCIFKITMSLVRQLDTWRSVTVLQKNIKGEFVSIFKNAHFKHLTYTLLNISTYYMQCYKARNTVHSLAHSYKHFWANLYGRFLGRKICDVFLLPITIHIAISVYFSSSLS